MYSEPLCPRCSVEMEPVRLCDGSWRYGCSKCATKRKGAPAKTRGWLSPVRSTKELAKEAAMRVSLQAPLTLDELKTMHGMPVWVEDIEKWAIVEVCTRHHQGVFVNGVVAENHTFSYDVKKRGLKCWRQKPDDLSRAVGRIINE